MRACRPQRSVTALILMPWVTVWLSRSLSSPANAAASVRRSNRDSAQDVPESPDRDPGQACLEGLVRAGACLLGQLVVGVTGPLLRAADRLAQVVVGRLDDPRLRLLRPCGHRCSPPGSRLPIPLTQGADTF